MTGGAGFIGGTTAARLVQAGHHVTILDDLRSGHEDAIPTDARFVFGGIGDPQAVDRAIADGVDACVHFAALIEAGESMRRPERFFANNTAATLLLLERLMDAGVSRFVLSSTAAVYGEPQQVPIGEDAPTTPTNAYGASKLFVEQALEWLHRLRGLRYAALRYFNAAGSVAGLPERHTPETHLIPIVLEVALGLRPYVEIYGDDYATADGTCVRDYVDVADLADAHVLALDALEEQSRIVCNLGSGQGYSVLQVVAAARAVTGHPIPVRVRPRRDGDPAVLVAAADSAVRALSWKPVRSDLSDIIASAWEHHAARVAEPAHPTVRGTQ